MSELKKANTDLAYFLTITVVGWIDIFPRNRYNEIIMNSLKYCQLNKALDIFRVCNNAQPYPIELKTASVIDQKIEYVHNNQVEAGLVLRPECWQYSSATGNEQNRCFITMMI